MHDVGSFDRFAGVYDRLMWPPDPEPVEEALECARRDVSRVLDVGGGTGRVARALARETTVVDAAPGMVRRTRRHDVPGVVGDAARVPVRDGAVDGVVVVDALHHFADAPAAVSEAHRVLAPGGVLVVRDFDPTTLRGRAVAAGERLAGFGSTFRSPRDMCSVMEGAGFEASLAETGFAFTAVGVRPEPGEP